MKGVHCRVLNPYPQLVDIETSQNHGRLAVGCLAFGVIGLPQHVEKATEDSVSVGGLLKRLAMNSQVVNVARPPFLPMGPQGGVETILQVRRPEKRFHQPEKANHRASERCG